MDKAYPTYQYSIFLKGSKDEQLVIRADNWDEFVEAKKKANAIISKVEAAPQVAAQPKPSDVCNKCGAEMINNPKTGKWFCKNKCWLNK